LGLDVGHAVRTLTDTVALAWEHLSCHTALLDVRWVAGDRNLVEALRTQSAPLFQGEGLRTLVEGLSVEAEGRHARFGDSLYLLEPEVKLGRGGLRDIDMARWLMAAGWGPAPAAGQAPRGELLPRELGALTAATDMLWRVRHLLHQRAHRRQDRLTFADQEEVATALGFVDGVTLGVEQFMQAYYRHSSAAAHTAERLRDRLRAALGPRLRPEATAHPWLLTTGTQLQLHDDAPVAQDVRLLFAVYESALQHHQSLAPATRDRIARLAVDPEAAARLRASPEAKAAFCRLLTHIDHAPFRQGSVLGELHEVGLMMAMLPEFQPLLGRVQHDIYHVYTVDVHSVAAVDRLRAVMRGEWADSWPLASRLAAETPRPLPLFLGVLLHDIGKARGKRHAEHGAELSGPIAERLDLSAADAAHVVWLVREHLSLYHWAMKRDLSCPEVVAEVAAQIGTRDRLRDLYLLTMVDLGTTNPKALTSWKARMLEVLFVAVDAVLAAGQSDTPAGRAAAVRRQLDAALGPIADHPAVAHFLAAMPDRYFLSHSLAALQRQAQALADSSDPCGAPLQLLSAPLDADPSSVELAIIARDRAGWLAQLTALFAAHRLSVRHAQVYTWCDVHGRARALDVFVLKSLAQAERLDAHTLQQLHAEATDLAEDKLAARDLIARIKRPPSWARRPQPKVETTIHIDNQQDRGHTILEVYAADALGLLHHIAQVVAEQGLAITLAKVNTEGACVADVFYLRRPGGSKLEDETQCNALITALRHRLAEVLQ
ncbi:MAG: HD domain-containing protein, partial [Polyangiales bacterium]